MLRKYALIYFDAGGGWLWAARAPPSNSGCVSHTAIGGRNRTLRKDALGSWAMKLTDREIQLLARLSRDRRLYAECNGADIDALQRLGLLQWFDARSSTTPFKEDLRLFLKLYGVSSRIDYAWVAAVNDWRERVGPEVSAKVDAVDESEWAVNSGPLNGAGLVEQTRSGPISLDASAARCRMGGAYP